MTGAAALAGLLLSPLLRLVIARYAVPEGTRWRGPRPGRRPSAPRPGVVEVVAAGALALVVWGLARAPVLTLLAACWLVLVGVALAFVDLEVRRLPDHLTLAAAGGVFVLLAAEGEPGRLGRAVLCGAAAAACYFALAFALPSGMGLGDVKLAFPLGLALGWWGGVVTLLGVAAGFLLHGILTLVLLVTRRVERRGHLPHGPAMIVGAVVVIAVLGT